MISRQAKLVVSAVVVAAGGFAGLSVWRARQAVSATRVEVEAANDVRFHSVTLDRKAPQGFELFKVPAAFSDVAEFAGSIWLCGPAGLFEFDENGLARRSFRVGLELPPAELTRMAVAVAGDSQTQELWISTRGEGLLAFDGKAFRHIRPEQPEFRKVQTLRPQSNGRVLFGTEKSGVLVFDGKRIAPLHPSLAKLNVTELEGDESDLWIGTMDRGAAHYRAGELHWLTALPDKRVLAIERDSSRAFIGTPLGVAEVQGDQVQREHGKSLFVQALLLRDKTLLAGTLEDGLIELPLAVRPQRPRLHRANPAGGDIRRLLVIGDKLMVLTESGLSVDGKPFIRNPEALLADRNIAALSADESGRLWIGYFDRGLEIVDGERSVRAENDVLFCVNRIVPDAARQRTLVGTANGLAILDHSGVMRQAIRKNDGLIASHVTDLMVAPDGEVTVATPAGVTFWRGQGDASSIYAFHGLVNNHVYSLGSCWGQTLVGTLGGVSMVERGMVRASYTAANSPLGHNWITGVATVGDECFVGTYGAGLAALDRLGNWRRFEDLPGGFEVNPNAMAVTESAVYAGTLNRGLAIYDRRSKRWSWQTEGLPSLNVTALAARNGTIFVGTENGLVRVPEGALAH